MSGYPDLHSARKDLENVIECAAMFARKDRRFATRPYIVRDLTSALYGYVKACERQGEEPRLYSMPYSELSG